LHNYWWANDLTVTVPNMLDGKWHHVAATYDGTTRKIYFDGVLMGQDNPTGLNITAPSIIQVGKTCCSEYWNGGLRDVRIWNLARTQAELMNNMYQPLAGTETGLIVNLKLDEATGSTIAADNAGGDHNGVLQNMNAGNSWIVPCSEDFTNTATVNVYSPTSSSITTNACDSYVLNAQTYTLTGVYTQTVTNSVGCDSTITLNLTINSSETNSFNDIGCDSYTWNATTYSASGTYQQVLQNMNGCDSTVTLNLTINNSDATSFNDAACDSYTWNGTTYTSSGAYQQTFQNMNGCDSTVTLSLTINNSSSSTVTDAACDTYTFLGNTYTSSGTYTVVIPNNTGCDSVITLNLTVNTVDVSVTQANENMSANAAGAAYQWLDCDNSFTVLSGETNQNFSAQMAGNFAVEVTENGCVDTSGCFNVIATGIAYHTKENNVVLYPNPVSGSFTAELNVVASEKADVSFINAAGQLLFAENLVLSKGKNALRYNVSEYAKGVYYLKITTANKVFVERVVIQ
jgi:hypothetical protein